MAAREALLCVALLAIVRHSAAGYREQVAHAEKRQSLAAKRHSPTGSGSACTPAWSLARVPLPLNLCASRVKSQYYATCSEPKE